MRNFFLSVESHPELTGQSAANTCFKSLTHIKGQQALCLDSGNRFLGIHFNDQQPPALDTETCWMLMDGEIENLQNLKTEYLASQQQKEDTVDLQAILHLYKVTGTDFLDRLKGAFVLGIIDHESGSVVLYRSRFGQYPFYYHAGSERIIASSEERAIVAHPAVTDDVDEATLTSIFSLNSSHPVGHTAFAQVSELLPGECLIWTKGEVKQWRFPLSFGQSPIRYRTDLEYADHYREILGRMVSRCLPEEGKVGVMLSSGIDSAPAAAIAAQQLKKRGQTLTAYSWALPGFETADESDQIRQVAAFANIPLNLVPASDRWPLYDRDNLHITANSPLSNAFQGLKDSVLEKAAADGCRVILNGWYGDRLFMFNQRRLITDAFRRGQAGLAMGELLFWLQQQGFKGLWDRFRPVRKNHELDNLTNDKPWLTELSLQHLVNENWPPEAEQHRHPDHFMSMTGPGNFQFGGYSKASFGRFGIEQRDLYRDEELIDFMLSIPLTQLMRLGQTKFIARNAAKGLIPENIRLQKRVGVLSEFFNYGIWQKEREWLRERLFDSQCSWDEYVDREWLTRQFKEALPSEKAGLVAWQCLTYELWLEKVRELESKKRSMQ